MAVNDLLELTFLSTLHNQEVRNVRHYRVSLISGGSPTAEQQESALISISSQITTAMKNCASNEWALYGQKCQRVWPVPRTVGTYSSGNAGAGAVSENSLPSEVTAVVKLKTAFAGRKYRGRMYMAGVPVTFETDSLITGAGQTLYNTLSSVLDGVLGIAVGGISYEFTPIILHRSAPGTWTDILNTTGLVDPILRSQRRRQPGKGQ